MSGTHMGPESKGRPASAEALAERASEYFLQGGRTCSEAVLQAACDALGIESPLIPDIALGLGGGVGQTGQICGAVSGCALALSLAAKEKIADYKSRKPLVMKAVANVCTGIASRFGAVTCSEISGLDFRKEEDRRKHVESGRVETCAPVVKEAARLFWKEIEAL